MIGERLDKQSGWKNAPWTKKVMRGQNVSSGAHLHVPVIEADPDSYDTPDGYRAITLGRNTLWLFNTDLGRWRGEQTIDLAEPYSDRKVQAAIRSLKTMRGSRYLLFTELDDRVDETSSPNSAEMYIKLESAGPSSPFSVPDSATEEWRIFSDIPEDTTLLIRDVEPIRMLAFETPSPA